MQMTTCLTSWKSIQRTRIRREFRGSVGVREPGMKREKCRRTWETLPVPADSKLVGLSNRIRGRPKTFGRESDQLILLRGRESRLHGEGVDRNMNSSLETISGRARPEPILQTTLMGIASKARRDKEYRFRDLYRQLNYNGLRETWSYLNKKSASGVDKVSAKEFAESLDENINKIVDHLKGNRYHAKLVRRVYIEKGNGKLRPLGIPTTSDKLLQSTVSRILEAIYEQDFYKSSHGYRPHKSVHTAITAISKELQHGHYAHIVEADIKGFFDNIDHDCMIKFLEHRIEDKKLLRLIRKWLEAGILEPDQQIINPKTGTPQGGSISPILANIYLHYVLDRWFNEKIKEKCKGVAYLCRYADDFICAFRFKADADKFMKLLEERFEAFGLELSKEKTNTLKFTRFEKKKKNRASFEFLGFEFRWGKSLSGKDSIKRRTSRNKLRKSIKNLLQWCKENRHLRLRKFFDFLNVKLRGYYTHYGIIGNSESLYQYHEAARQILFKWLNRRSQRKSFNWKTFNKIVKIYNMVTPKIYEKNNDQLKLDFCFV